MRKPCHCKRYLVEAEDADYVVDGVPVCRLTCMERIDAAIIAEQIAFRNQHGLEALRASPFPSRNIVVGGRHANTKPTALR